jgi:hypothetical protein
MQEHNSQDDEEYTPQCLRAVEAAHDVLVGVLAGLLPCPYPEIIKVRLEHYAEALCWVLGHTKEDSAGKDFREFLMELTERIMVEVGARVESRVKRHGNN